MSTEPPSPVWIPPLVQHTHRGICWSDVVADITRDDEERARSVTDTRQEHDVDGLEAA